MLVFLKLGGSLITDKQQPETPRRDVIERLSAEIHDAFLLVPGLQLVLGHGSGSYGHVAGARYGTRDGVSGPNEWRGFSEVSVTAARLNHIVLEALYEAGLPVFRVQPSALARCSDGRITYMHLEALHNALDQGLLPLVYGDVAFDEIRGGTIISTEEIADYLARQLQPDLILLAAEVDGVLDASGRTLPLITPQRLPDHANAIGGSAAIDVTGGMASKVDSMLRLCQDLPGLQVRIFAGSQPGAVFDLLTGRAEHGTLLTSQE